MADLILSDEEVRTGCGIGQGARCCKYLLSSATDWICGRESELRQTLIDAKGYSAQRLPTEPYPDCQLKVI